jgi:hypothetical protein
MRMWRLELLSKNETVSTVTIRAESYSEAMSEAAKRFPKLRSISCVLVSA